MISKSTKAKRRRNRERHIARSHMRLFCVWSHFDRWDIIFPVCYTDMQGAIRFDATQPRRIAVIGAQQARRKFANVMNSIR